MQEGYSLFALARKYYNTANPTIIDLILKVNPDITDVHRIRIDQQIRLPEINEESLVILDTDNTYKIHIGTFIEAEYTRQYYYEPVIKGKEIDTIPQKVSNRDTWYRVTVGSFGSKEESLNIITHLKQKGLLPSLGSPSNLNNS